MHPKLLQSLMFSLPAAALSLWSFVSYAAEAEDIIKYRAAVMKSQGGHAGAAATIVRGKVDFADDLLYHAEALDASLKTVISLFPPGSDFGETRAKPAVWQKRAAFEKSAKDAEKKGAAFLAAVKANDKTTISAKFKGMIDACKACHKDFREKKKE